MGDMQELISGRAVKCQNTSVTQISAREWGAAIQTGMMTIPQTQRWTEDSSRQWNLWKKSFKTGWLGSTRWTYHPLQISLCTLLDQCIAFNVAKMRQALFPSEEQTGVFRRQCCNQATSRHCLPGPDVDILAQVWLPAREIVESAVKKGTEIDSSSEIIHLETGCPWKEHLYDLEKELSVKSPIKYVLYGVKPQKFPGRYMPYLTYHADKLPSKLYNAKICYCKAFGCLCWLSPRASLPRASTAYSDPEILSCRISKEDTGSKLWACQALLRAGKPFRLNGEVWGMRSSQRYRTSLDVCLFMPLASLAATKALMELPQWPEKHWLCDASLSTH